MIWHKGDIAAIRLVKGLFEVVRIERWGLRMHNMDNVTVRHLETGHEFQTLAAALVPMSPLQQLAKMAE